MNGTSSKPEFDPGAMQFGNFINYYQFHPPEDRTSLLTPDIWDMIKVEGDLTCLDVGCNCGDLTESLHRILLAQNTGVSKVPLNPNNSDISKQVKILGIDIDETLIDRANEKNGSRNIAYKCLDIMKPNSMEYLRSYLKENLRNTEENCHPDEEESTEVAQKLDSTLKLNNLAQNNRHKRTDFESKCRDILDETSTPAYSDKFSIVFCFSVTMWIHLNHGDSGLYEFLQKIVSLGKYLVLENQPWKCYRNAQRRMVKSSIKRKKLLKDDKEKHGESVKNRSQISEAMGGMAESHNKLSEDDIQVEIRNVRPEGISKQESEEVGFTYYRELKLRSDVDKQIDVFLREKCAVRKLYESVENEWGRVITVYQVL